MRLEALFATHSDVKGLWPNTRGWVAAICRGSEGVRVTRGPLGGVGVLCFYQSSSKGSKVKQVQSLSYRPKSCYADAFDRIAA